MQIDVRVDLKNAERYLQGLRKDQVPFATAYALTQTAKDSQQRIVDDMRRSFDRPKPFTLNGTFVSPATKSRLEATVKLKDGYARGGGENSKRGTPDKYLRAQVQGGARRNTAFERMLIHNGLMPLLSLQTLRRAMLLATYRQAITRASCRNLAWVMSSSEREEERKSQDAL